MRTLRDHVVARRQQREERRADGAHPRGGQKGRFRALQRGDDRLGALRGGIAVACVIARVARGGGHLRKIRIALGREGRGLVDGGRDIGIRIDAVIGERHERIRMRDQHIVLSSSMRKRSAISHQVARGAAVTSHTARLDNARPATCRREIALPSTKRPYKARHITVPVLAIANTVPMVQPAR